MGSRRFFLFLLGLFIVSFECFSQESPGIVQSNYGGSMMARLNPSTMLQSKVYMDFNVISFTAFGQNDFAYVPGSDINIIPLVTGQEAFPTFPPSDNNFKYSKNQKTKSVSAISNVYAFSGMVQIKDQVFAFHTAVRSYTSGHNLPYEIPVLGAESMAYTPLHNINFIDNKFSAASLNWAEIGFSYATTIYQESVDHWAAGITVNRLMGLGAGFVKAQNVDYVVLNRNTIQINDMNVDAGMALPIDYQTNEILTNPLFKGGGFGFDLGLTYTRKTDGFQYNHSRRLCEDNYKEYDWRFGVSILDLGSISFKNNAQLHQFNNVNALLENIDKMNFTNVDQLMGELSTKLLGDPNASLIGDSFKIGLPTAFSAQYDYHLSPDWYLNATIVHPFSISQYSVRRPAEIAISPRYETDWFEFMGALSLYEYQTVRMGAAVRMGILTIGSDQLATLLGFGKIQGMDIYASVKINFRKGVCLFEEDSGACSTDYSYKPRRKSLLHPRR